MRSLSLPRRAAFLVVLCCTFAGESTRAAEEPAGGKLVIVSAVYGDLDNDKTADVTAKVAAMVKDNSLSVAATKENFGEPSPAPRQLKVGYTIEGVYRSKTVDEGDTLDISTRLVIVKAVYGDLTGGKTDDVTQQLADGVRKNKLTIKADNSTFGDPAEGVVKKLKVEYLFDGKRETKTIGENETLNIGE